MNVKHTLNQLFGGAQFVGRRTFLAAAVMSIAGAASAQHTLGLKFGQNGNGNQQGTAVGAVQPGDLAGAPGYAQTNWNVLGRWGDNGTNSFGTNNYALLDSGGDNTQVTIEWDATGNWSVQGSGTPTDQGDPDRNLMNAYSDSGGSGNVALTNGVSIYGQSGNNKPMIYISGLQAWLATEGASSYDVVIYVDGDNQGGRTGEYWLVNTVGPISGPTFGSDLTTHVFIRDFNNFTVNPAYQKAPLSSNNGRVASSGNYAVFPGLSTDSFLLRTEEFSTRSGINALQIIPRTTPIGAVLDPLLPASTYAGGRATFRVKATGVVPFAYQWQKNGVNLVDGANISGSTNATLNISTVSAPDAGNYSVVVSNAGGFTTSTIAPLAVTSPVAGSYPEKVFTNGAVAYWRFNETGDPSTNFSVAYDPIGGFNLAYGPLSQNAFNGIPGPQPTDFPGFEANNAALRTTFSTTRSEEHTSELQSRL